jgi:hypothetical protein
MTLSNQLTPDTVVSRRQDIVSAPVGDEIAMMNVEKGMYYGLNDIGARIWDMLSTPIVVSELCQRLLATYDVDEATCCREVLAFLGELAEADVLDIVSA